MSEETNVEPCILERDKNGIIRIKYCQELFIADREAFQKLLDERNEFLVDRDRLKAFLLAAICRLETIRETHGLEIALDRDIEIYRAALNSTSPKIVVAEYWHNPKIKHSNLATTTNRPLIRKEQVVGSNPTSGSIL